MLPDGTKFWPLTLLKKVKFTALFICFLMFEFLSNRNERAQKKPVKILTSFFLIFRMLAYFTASAIALKASGLFIAKSAKALRLSSMPLA